MTNEMKGSQPSVNLDSGQPLDLQQLLQIVFQVGSASLAYTRATLKLNGTSTSGSDNYKAIENGAGIPRAVFTSTPLVHWDERYEMISITFPSVQVIRCPMGPLNPQLCSINYDIRFQ